MAKKPPSLPSDIPIYSSPWVSGTRAAAYFGPIAVESFIEDTRPWRIHSETWLKGLFELAEQLRLKAFQLGANHIVGFEFQIDLWHHRATPGVLYYMSGTAALLEPLWDG